MKILATSLGFYILFLAIFPTFVNLKVAEKKMNCQKNCCHLTKTANQKTPSKKEGGCSKGRCNPFFGCLKIQVLVPYPVPLKFKPEITNNTYKLFVESYLSTTLSSIWHPPKVV